MQILYGKQFKKGVKLLITMVASMPQFIERLIIILASNVKKMFLRCFVEDYDTKLNMLDGNELSVIFVRRQSNEGYKCIIF